MRTVLLRRLYIIDAREREDFFQYLRHAKASPRLGADGRTVWWEDEPNVIPFDAAFYTGRSPAIIAGWRAR